MKYCKNCGMQISDDSEYCVHCGEKVECYTRVDVVDEDFTTYPEVKERSIVKAIILSIVTLGIYSIYWMIKLNDESLAVCKEKGKSGIVVFLLNIITLGIYEYIWWYKMGARCDKMRGNENGFVSILYVGLAVFGLSIVNYALSQDAINNSLTVN